MALAFVTAQLPGLIEKYEPTIEENLTTALSKLKEDDATNAKLFLDNWRKLDTVVERVLGSKTAGKKRTRKRKNRK
jgi:uncharacterized protein YdcH (DUF465 family)